VSRHTGVRILSRGLPVPAVLAVSAALLLTLCGCVPGAPAATSVGRSSTATASSSPSITPGPTASGSPTPAPSTPPATPVAGDPAGAKALAVRACQAISGGFAAGSVAQAAPLAAQAAARDSLWGPLAADLDFIQKNPIDPNTGEGPQQTADDASAAAHDCFTLAGVQVSQD
jgi:hypothetical protein